MKIEQIAQIVHEIQEAYCEAIGEEIPSWEFASIEMMETTIDGVRFHIENPCAGEGASHANWVRKKVADGWIYGPVRDWEKKTHPSLVPFRELPRDERIKDILFVQTVRSLAPYLD